MQGRFNKDLEEIKKSQYIMNNAINEIKNTLEGTNSKITKAKYKWGKRYNGGNKWSREEKRKKELKEMRTTQRPPEQC